MTRDKAVIKVASTRGLDQGEIDGDHEAEIERVPQLLSTISL